mgnify:CR=1 FL=1
MKEPMMADSHEITVRNYKQSMRNRLIIMLICIGIALTSFFVVSKWATSRWGVRRVNQQVQNYKTCLKNSRFGVEKFNFSLGLSFNFFCIDIILLSV